MGDIPVAPQATSSPAPAEVQIPDSGAHAPSPLSNQAPQKSPEQIQSERAGERNAARRESIEKAFAKGTEEAEERAAREPPREGRAPDKAPQAQRQRGEGGRFVGQQAESGQQGNMPRQGADQAARPAPPPLPREAPFRDPPPRFSDAAKQDWASVPESVRGATHQTVKEMWQGMQHYKQAADTFETIRDFHDLATRHGTDLRSAMTNYVSMENKLNSDLLGGLDMIVNNWARQHGQQVNLRDIAAYVLNMSPEQHRMNSQQNAQQSQQLQMGQLHQTVESLANSLQQMQYNQQFAYARSGIDQFADSPGHERFDELSDLIKAELDAGYDLESAYRRANLLRPSTQAAQTRTRTAQTRTEIDRSISGAPNGYGPSAHGNSRDRKSPSTRDAVTNALRRVRSSL